MTSSETLAAFLLALSQPDNDDVNENEQVRFNELTAEAQEIVRTASMRIKARINSLDQAQREYVKLSEEWHDAQLNFAEDPDDNFEVAYYKDFQAALIDGKFAYACNRLNFELRDSAKVGITQARSY